MSLNLHTCPVRFLKENGRIEVTGRRGRRRKQQLDDLKGKKRILETERGSTRSQSVENSFWKRLTFWRRNYFFFNFSTPPLYKM